MKNQKYLKSQKARIRGRIHRCVILERPPAMLPSFSLQTLVLGLLFFSLIKCVKVDPIAPSSSLEIKWNAIIQ